MIAKETLRLNQTLETYVPPDVRAASIESGRDDNFNDLSIWIGACLDDCWRHVKNLMSGSAVSDRLFQSVNFETDLL